MPSKYQIVTRWRGLIKIAVTDVNYPGHLLLFEHNFMCPGYFLSSHTVPKSDIILLTEIEHMC